MNDSHEEFLRLIQLNPTVQAVLERFGKLDLPDTWLAGGCLFQTAWNVLAAHAPTRAIRDYDIFYFDPQACSAQAEEEVNRRAGALYADLHCSVDVRNQARVHTWYAEEFGVDGYPQLHTSTDGIDHFLAVCCMVGVRRTPAGMELYAPLGVDDILARIMRPNPRFPAAPRSAYERKAERWSRLWPDLKVEPFADALSRPRGPMVQNAAPGVWNNE